MTQNLQDVGVWSELVKRLPADLDLSKTARQCRAFRRARGVRSAEDLLRLALIYGTTSLSLRGTAAWASAQGLADISDVALLLRLQGCDAWLQEMMAGLLSQAVRPIGATAAVDRRVRLIDATVISNPGSGTWRLHADYDLRGGRFIGFELSDQHGAESLNRFKPASGDLFVGDRYYAKAAQLAHVAAHGGDFLVRRGLTSCRLQQQDGRPLNVRELLKTLKHDQTRDFPVLVPLADGQAPLQARLIIRHIGQEHAEKGRRRARRKAAKNGQTASDKRLKAAEYIMVMTSLPADQASADQLLHIYRLRWQIELAFKRLKSLMGLGDLLAKDPRLIRSSLYAKLILALITEDITCNVLDSFPSAPRHRGALNLAAREPHLSAAYRSDPRHIAH